MTDPYDTEAPGAQASGAPGADTRRPGDRPATPHIDELLRQARREQARRVNALGAIRAHLEEQPTAYTVRECKRRWCSDIAAIAEDVITTMNNTEDAA